MRCCSNDHFIICLLKVPSEDEFVLFKTVLLSSIILKRFLYGNETDLKQERRAQRPVSDRGAGEPARASGLEELAGAVVVADDIEFRSDKTELFRSL